MAEKFDLLVIGDGAAGGSAASAATKAGKRVALVEKNKPGGTCLNYGCDPTKTLLNAAHRLYQARHSAEFGLQISRAEVDWTVLQTRVRSVIDQLRGGSLEQAFDHIRQEGITVFRGEARFISPNRVRVGQQEIEASQILIATGTIPAIPRIKGLSQAGFITNTEVVSLTALPESLAIIGGGVIGIEFAQLFSRLGVKVTVVEHGKTILDTEDQELVNLLRKLLEKEGITILTDLTINEIQHDIEKKILQLTHKDSRYEEIRAEQILVAAGRQPVLEGLGLAEIGLETTKHGIQVDQFLRTNVPNIWAAGDIADPLQFTHVATEQGELVASNAFATTPRPFNRQAIPWVAFTQPELAHVGQTEDELKKANKAYRVARVSFDKVERAITDGVTDGMLKVLADKKGMIWGAHILAEKGGELLAPLVLMMRHDLPLDSLADTILPYPTLGLSLKSIVGQLQNP